MKRICSVMLCFIMTCVPLSGGIGAENVSPDYETLLFEDFEGSEYLKFYDDGKSATYGKTVDIGEYAAENMFSVSEKSTVNTAPFEKTFILSDAEGYNREKKNVFVETEFDAYVKASQYSPVISLFSYDTTAASAGGITVINSVRFNNETKEIELLAKREKRGAQSGTYTSLANFENEKIYRIKIVFHVSENSGDSAEEISAVYINGENVLPGGRGYYMLSYSAAKVGNYEALRISNARSIYLDNIGVYRYASSLGTSPVPDKGRLVSLIRSADSAISFRELENAKCVYENPLATQSEIDLAYAALYKDLKEPVNDIVPIFSEDFEGEAPTKFYDDQKTAEYGQVENCSVFGMGNAFISMFKATVNSAPFERIYLMSEAEGYSAAETNSYVETEFDAVVKQSEAEVAMFSYNSPDGTNIISVKFSKEGEIQVGSRRERRSGVAGYTSVEKYEYNKPYRIRAIFHISDSSGASCEELTALYVNGRNVLSEKHFMKSHNVQKVGFYESIRLMNAGNLYIDNIKVYKYESRSGESPVLDKGKLVSLIREAETLGMGIDEEVLSEAKTIYENSYNKSRVEAAAAALERLLPSYSTMFSLEKIETVSQGGDEGSFIYENGILKAAVLKKLYNAPFSGKFYAALYSPEGKLKSVKACNAEIPEGESEITVEINAEMNADVLDWYLKLYMLDENITPVMDAVKIVSTDEDVRFENCVVYNGDSLVKTDCLPVVLNNGECYVPANNIINFLGMPLEKNGKAYSAVRQDGASLAFTAGESIYKINGSEYAANKAVYLEDGYAPMVSAEAIERAFGAELKLSYNGKSAALNIYNNYEEDTFPTLKSGGITFDTSFPSPSDVNFFIPYGDRNAKVRVWARLNSDSLPNLSAFSSAGSSSKWSGFYKFGLDNSLIYYWKEAGGIYYDSASSGFRGAFGDIVTGGRKYDIKVSITSGGTEKTFVTKNCFTAISGSENYYPKTRNEFLYKTNGELLVYPTYENISYYIDNAVQAERCSITYGKKGTTEKKAAYPPYYDETAMQWRGSITGLHEGCEYTVRAELFGSDGEVVSRKEAEVKMWSSTPSIDRVINLDDVYSGSGVLNLCGIKGTENGWIKVDCGGQTVNVENGSEAVYIANCEYMILENLKITGGNRTGILVAASAKNVRISNCDISNWGRRGVYDKEYLEYVADGGVVNYEAGIRMLNASNITVERCYIHDSKSRTNPWKAQGELIHPKGSCGIYYQVKDSCVIRYNDIIGSDENRFNDGIEGANNTADYGGAARNTDIYGNTIFGCEDDGVELDGAQMNVRFYNNRIEQTLCGVSTAPLGVGPTYIFRNVITNAGTLLDNFKGTAIKAGGATSGENTVGKLFVFNNTIDTVWDVMRNVGVSGSYEYHTDALNNIFVSRTSGGAALINTYADSRDYGDFNLLLGEVDFGAGNNQHSTNNLPTYKENTFMLERGSAGENSGCTVANFAESYSGSAVDMGALETETDCKVFPIRPIPASVSVQTLDLSGKEEGLLTLTNSADKEFSYSIETSAANSWLEISGVSGELKGGESAEIKVRADMGICGFKEGNAMIIIRLENGFGIPVSIYCQK